MLFECFCVYSMLLMSMSPQSPICRYHRSLIAIPSTQSNRTVLQLDPSILYYIQPTTLQLPSISFPEAYPAWLPVREKKWHVHPSCVTVHAKCGARANAEVIPLWIRNYKYRGCCNWMIIYLLRVVVWG